jgi:hypothetical protein
MWYRVPGWKASCLIPFFFFWGGCEGEDEVLQVEKALINSDKKGSASGW